ncbi:hypothetical protein L7F22_015076 [Adiantum nelumboides]|nr:hypothetical protein [Adiantum nelumboides]
MKSLVGRLAPRFPRLTGHQQTRTLCGRGSCSGHPVSSRGLVYEANRSFECAVRSLSDHRVSSFPLLLAITEAEGDAGQFTPLTLSFKRSMRNIATLYGCSASFKTIEEYRLTQTKEALCSKCLQATNLSAVLIDDGLRVEKMYLLEWHNDCAVECHVGLSNLNTVCGQGKVHLRVPCFNIVFRSMQRLLTMERVLEAWPTPCSGSCMDERFVCICHCLSEAREVGEQ